MLSPNKYTDTLKAALDYYQQEEYVLERRLLSTRDNIKFCREELERNRGLDQEEQEAELEN